MGSRGIAYGVLVALSAIARIAAMEGRIRQAAKLFGATDALSDRIHGVLPAFLVNRHREALEGVRETLPGDEFDAAYADGERLTLEEAIDEGMLAVALPKTREELTARELEILALVSEGLSNREVAERLVVSIRTVHAHLRSVYRKLGVGTRAAAARRAAELELV
jgi:DNA-binding NarL/FixJ family response regulator